jgi:hypothetical protein
MRVGKLRIAWSVAWGVVAVLLCVLWVRSYFHEDRASGRVFSTGIRFYSSRGWLVLFKNRAPLQAAYPWSIELGGEHWLQPADSRLGFSSPLAFFGRAATSHISLPHWLVILVALIACSLPWMHWPKRFSLRTLLIAITFIAVALGFVVWVSR